MRFQTKGSLSQIQYIIVYQYNLLIYNPILHSFGFFCYFCGNNTRNHE